MTRNALFEVGAHKVDQVLGQLWGNLLLGSVDQMEADVRLQHFGHQAVDASTNRGQQHQLISAILIARERALHGIELAAHFSHTLQQLGFFAILMRLGFFPILMLHESSLDNTHRGYGINQMGV